MWSLAPYNEWVPQMMGQDATSTKDKEVRLGDDWEQLLEGGDNEEVAADAEATEEGKEVTGLEEEVVDAHPSGGAANPSPALQLSQEVQQAIAHSHQVLQGKAPSVCARPPPQLPVAPRMPGAPKAPTALEKWQIKEAASKAHREVGGQQRPTGPQQATPHPHAPKSKASSSTGTRSAKRASVPSATTPANLPPQRRLSEQPKSQRGKRWLARMNKPYVPWGATQDQLWEAHRLLTGKDQWATPKPPTSHSPRSQEPSQ